MEGGELLLCVCVCVCVCVCQVRDGAALCEYLYWLEERMKEGTALTEISGADKLETLRM